MKTFAEDLGEAVAYHGHLCSGQLTGVRMARYALGLLGIPEPKGYRDLIVYVESDRCISDAISTVTGCQLGRRTLKCMDYGKSAATFMDLRAGKALRVRRRVRVFPPEGADLVAFYEAIPDGEMFDVQEVAVRYRQEDLPGKPLDAVVCARCGEEVIDGRQVDRDGETLCKACADGGYYDA